MLNVNQNFEVDSSGITIYKNQQYGDPIMLKIFSIDSFHDSLL